VSNNRKTRSPIKGKPLREPGQSLSEEIDYVINDRLLGWLFGGAMAIVFAVVEWWRWYQDAPFSPILFTVVAAVAVLLAALRYIQLRRRVKTLRLGRDGERVVGQFLEDMRAAGYHVVHDVIGEDFNIDHVVIGERGVYTVETKTLSLPAKQGGTVTCAGDKLLANKRPLQRDPIGQAKAQAAWLRRTLEESTGRDYRVQPVVVFPGWFVEPSCKSVADVWVLEPKALPKFIEHEQRRLSAEQANMAAYHLRLIVRAAGFGRRSVRHSY
jgi:hypothetical protein